MQEMQIFENEEFGKIRTVMINNEPWFVGNDCAKALGFKDPYSGIRKNVDDEDKQTCPVGMGTGMRNMNVINESGLYSLIFGSKLESAKKFKRWVTSEVLPSIRKTGQYSKQTNDVQYTKADIPVGEIARLSSVMDRVMVRQNSKPHDIARAFEMLCGQFGIVLPDNFVNVPEYEQLTLETIGR